MSKADPAVVWHTLAAIRDQRPLVHNIRNLVVTNSTAHALLAISVRNRSAI
jgi:hydroxyethylthiazole kinase